MRVGLVAPVASAALGASAEDMSAEEDISLSRVCVREADAGFKPMRPRCGGKH